MTTREIEDICFNADVVASEVLRFLIAEGNEISDEQIRDVLEWTGDDEYVTVEDIRE